MFGFSFGRVWSFERVWLFIRRRLAFRSKAFGFSFERVWLFVQMRLATRSNAFGYSFERIWLLLRTSFVQHSNASIRGAKAFEQKMRYALYLTGTVYDVPASIDLINLSFSSIDCTTFLRLNFSAILCSSLKFYSIDNVTTAHAQSSQGCVQIMEGSYN